LYDPGTLYTDPILTDFSTGFRDQTLYGDIFAPETPVRTQSGRYRVFDRSGWLIYPSRREPGTVANEIRGAKWSEDTFFTSEHSLQAPVWDEERQEFTSLGGLANAVFGGDLSIDPETDATAAVIRSIELEHELTVANSIRNTANYPVGNTVTLAGAQQWNDYTNGVTSTSDPVGVIRTAIAAIWTATRRYPNLMAIPSMGVPIIENHPRIIDRFKNFSLLQEDAFRLLTGFEGRIITVDSVYNSAQNIDATPVISDFWGKDVWLGIVDPTPGQRTQTFMKTFSQIYPNGTTRPVDRWREEGRKSDLVRASRKWAVKIVSNNAGYIVKNAFGASAF
jgi:hypothetical protein